MIIRNSFRGFISVLVAAMLLGAVPCPACGKHGSGGSAPAQQTSAGHHCHQLAQSAGTQLHVHAQAICRAPSTCNLAQRAPSKIVRSSASSARLGGTIQPAPVAASAAFSFIDAIPAAAAPPFATNLRI